MASGGQSGKRFGSCADSKGSGVQLALEGGAGFSCGETEARRGIVGRIGRLSGDGGIRRRRVQGNCTDHSRGIVSIVRGDYGNGSSSGDQRYGAAEGPADSNCDRCTVNGDQLDAATGVRGCSGNAKGGIVGDEPIHRCRDRQVWWNLVQGDRADHGCDVASIVCGNHGNGIGPCDQVHNYAEVPNGPHGYR